MTIEQKAKAYDKAIEKIKYVMEHGVSPVLSKEDLQDLFPELAESEDERIREAQLDYWRSVGGKEWYGVPVQETIAWLEKQGELISEAYEKGFTEGKRIERKAKEPKWSKEDNRIYYSLLADIKARQKDGENSPILSNSAKTGKNWSEPTLLRCTIMNKLIG